MALLDIGDKSISDLSEGTRRADICDTNYQSAIDEVTTMYEWCFATERASLSLEDEDPEYEYSYQFLLPSSPYCLTVREVYPECEYEIEGRKLLANETSLKIKYTARIEDESLFPPYFARACAKYLAYLIAWPLTGNRQVQQRVFGEFRLSLQTAIFADAKQKNDTDSTDESEYWINARDM
jgi:hypothetical protein